jgi:GTP-binding protein LepA
MHYLSADRVQLEYLLPLAEIVLDFFDQLKSRTKGYASLDYELVGLRASNLVKLDVLLAGDPSTRSPCSSTRTRRTGSGGR